MDRRRTPADVSGRSARLRSLGRHVIVGALSGGLVGLVVAGGGGRLAMRLIAMANRELYGQVTDAGAVVGKATLEGTVTILFVGIESGLGAGLLYVLLRRWIPGSAFWKGLLFGTYLLAVTGFGLVEDAPLDFQIFQPQTLSLALFAGLFLLGGPPLSLLVERFDPSPSVASGRRWVTITGSVVLAVVGVAGLLRTITTVAEIL